MFGHRKDACIAPRLADIGHDTRRAGNVHIVAQCNVSRQHGRTSNSAAFADGRRTCDSHAAGHRRMVANLHVVPEHDQIIQLHVIADDGIVQRTAVDRRIGANLNIVAKNDAAKLDYFGPATWLARSVRGKTEAVSTQYRALWIMQRSPRRTSA